MALNIDTTITRGGTKTQEQLAKRADISCAPVGKEGLEIMADPNLGNAIHQLDAGEVQDTSLIEPPVAPAAQKAPEQQSFPQGQQEQTAPAPVQMPSTPNAPQFSIPSSGTQGIVMLDIGDVENSFERANVIREWTAALNKATLKKITDEKLPHSEITALYVKNGTYSHLLTQLNDIITELCACAGGKSDMKFLHRVMPDVHFATGDISKASGDVGAFLEEIQLVFETQPSMVGAINAIQEWYSSAAAFTSTLGVNANNDGSVTIVLPPAAAAVEISLTLSY